MSSFSTVGLHIKKMTPGPVDLCKHSKIDYTTDLTM